MTPPCQRPCISCMNQKVRIPPPPPHTHTHIHMHYDPTLSEAKHLMYDSNKIKVKILTRVSPSPSLSHAFFLSPPPPPSYECIRQWQDPHYSSPNMKAIQSITVMYLIYLIKFIHNTVAKTPSPLHAPCMKGKDWVSICTTPSTIS